MIREHSFFFLPNLLSFTNGNTYLGSFLGLRFRIKPSVRGEGDEKEEVLECLCWYGENCLEKSEIVAETSFPLSAAGREQVIDWLEEQYFIMPKPETEEELPAGPEG